jgi:hypothetical protein
MFVPGTFVDLVIRLHFEDDLFRAAVYKIISGDCPPHNHKSSNMSIQKRRGVEFGSAFWGPVGGGGFHVPGLAGPAEAATGMQ